MIALDCLVTDCGWRTILTGYSEDGWAGQIDYRRALKRKKYREKHPPKSAGPGAKESFISRAHSRKAVLRKDWSQYREWDPLDEQARLLHLEELEQERRSEALRASVRRFKPGQVVEDVETARRGLVDSTDPRYGTVCVKFDDDPEPLDVDGVMLEVLTNT